MKKNKYLVVFAHYVPTLPNKTLINTCVMVGLCKFLVVLRWKKSHRKSKYVGVLRVFDNGISK